MAAPAEHIEELMAENITIHGGAENAARLFAATDFQCAPRGTQARAVQLAIAYVMQHHADQPGSLRKLVHLKGDLKKVLRK